MTADATMLVLTSVVGLLAIASVVLVTRQVSRGPVQDRAEVERREVEVARMKAEVERLHGDNIKLTVGAVRLYSQVTREGGSPVWSPVNGDMGEVKPEALRQYSLLSAALQALFTTAELEVLASSIGINIEDIGGETRQQIAVRLVEAAKHAGLEEVLRSVVKSERPGAKL
jgi:hypothetical protein